jgi:hypothetical protein
MVVLGVLGGIALFALGAYFGEKEEEHMNTADLTFIFKSDTGDVEETVDTLIFNDPVPDWVSGYLHGKRVVMVQLDGVAAIQATEEDYEVKVKFVAS